MTLGFNLFEEHEFNSLFPDAKNGRESLFRDLLLRLITADYGVRSRSSEDLRDYRKSEIEGLVIALHALKDD